MSWFSSWFGSDDVEQEKGRGEGAERPEAVDERSPESREGAKQVDMRAPEEPWATVLYPFPLDLNVGELREILDGSDSSWERVEAGGDDLARLVLVERNVRLRYRDQPFPEDRMNRRLLPETFPADHAHVALQPEVSDPLEKRDLLREPGEYPDPWGEKGLMRELTALVRAFLSLDATAVVLNRANRLAVPSRQFREFTEGAADGDWRAAKAWLDIDAGGEEDELLTAEGLRVFGLPNVQIRVDVAEGWWRRQLQAEALDAALATMILENRPLGAGGRGDAFLGFEPIEEFRVPIGLDLDGDSGDVEVLREGGDHVPYRVDMEEGRLTLESRGPPTVWETWASIDENGTEIDLGAYQAMFRYECHEMLGTPLGSVEIGDIEGMPAVLSDLYPAEEARPAHLITNGLGRRARSTGEPGEGSSRVELAIRAETPAEPLIDILANCAAGFELSDEHWGPAEILEFEEPLHGFQAFLLAPLFEAVPERGPRIEVWQLVPLTEEEHGDLSEGGDAAGWLEERDRATGPEFAGRWDAAGPA